MKPTSRIITAAKSSFGHGSGCLPRLQLIWADSAYKKGGNARWVKETLGWQVEMVEHPWSGLRGVWAPKDAVIDWEKIRPSGFHVLKWRWIVERTFAWLSTWRRLAKDYEVLRSLDLRGHDPHHAAPLGSKQLLRPLHTASEIGVNPNIKLVEEYNYSGGPGSSCLLCFLLIALQRVNELSASPCIDQDNYVPSTSLMLGFTLFTEQQEALGEQQEPPLL